MQQERRSGHRTHLPGAHVVYESARHEPREADLLDVGAGGLFIPAVTPLPRGTRLALEIRLSRSGPSWPALGRVVWTRAAAPGRPGGMGVKIVDIDDAALEAIRRAIGPAAPARERTVRGIGLSTPPAAWVATKTGRNGRGRVVAAALVAAAVAAGALGVMQGRIPTWLGRTATAGTAAVTTTAETSALGPVVAPPSAPAPSGIRAGGSAAPIATAAASSARSPAGASGGRSKPASPAPRSPAWTAAPRRSTGAPSDNPY
jgi:hypothetical protein